MRLRDLGIAIGRLPPGSGNRISDVGGVRVASGGLSIGGSASGGGLAPENHLVRTGLTAVIPYLGAEERKLFVGRWSLDRGDGFTGLGVAEDFGLFSSPICLVAKPLVGQVYNEAIGYGLGRDSGLSIGMGWPPVVVGVEDGSWYGGDKYSFPGVQFESILSHALVEVAEGNVGIGSSLHAFGVKGGVGTASRLVDAAVVGVLVAANGGEPQNLCVDRFPVGATLDLGPAGVEVPRSFVGVVATDAPLIPRQLDRLAGRAALGLARVGLLDENTQEGLVLAFSTAAPQEVEGDVVEGIGLTGEGDLPHFFAAAAEACEEAVLNALLAARPLPKQMQGYSEHGPGLGVLPREDWPEQVRRYQKDKRG